LRVFGGLTIDRNWLRRTTAVAALMRKNYTASAFASVRNNTDRQMLTDDLQLADTGTKTYRKRLNNFLFDIQYNC